VHIICTFSEVIDSVSTDVEMLQMFCANEQLPGDHWHQIVRKIHAFKFVRDPLGLGEHLFGDERDAIMAQIHLKMKSL